MLISTLPARLVELAVGLIEGRAHFWRVLVDVDEFGQARVVLVLELDHELNDIFLVVQAIE
ncbi:hypothetical protein D3C75_1208830 [compost metagenome]